MFLKYYFEPFYELFFTKGKISFRCMRFFGRIRFFRMLGFDANYRNNIDCFKFKDIETIKEPSKIICEIKTNSFSDGLELSNKFLSILLNFIRSSEFIERMSRNGCFKIDPDNLHNPGNVDSYSIMQPHNLNQDILDFAVSEIKPIADAYLGANAVLMNSQIWATFPNDDDSYNPEFGFHYDLDDYRFLKVFFYLSEVDRETGPHEIIRGSHIGKPFFRFFNRRLREPLPDFYKDRVVTMIGKQGQGFFEDTICYHRGKAVKSKGRLIFQLQFAISGKNWNN